MNLYLPLGVLAAMALSVLASRYITKRRLRQTRRSGLALLSQLKELVVRQQQHRGLSSSYLKGNQQALSDLQRLQQELRSWQTRLNDHAYITKQTRWQSYLQHWQRLHASWQSNTLENNITQHSLMIRNLLYFAEDIAIEFEINSLDGQGLSVSFLWHELLLTAESIGQARALGSGLASAGHSSSVERIRLSFLHQKIAETDPATLDQYSYWLLPEKQLRWDSLARLQQTIEQDLIKTETPSISVQEYFRQATEVLDAIYQVYDAGIEHLSREA